MHELVDRLPAGELLAWRKWLMEPRGDSRADWHAAQISKCVHDVALGFNGKSNPQGLETYLLSFRMVEELEMNRRNMVAARSFFGKVVPC